MVDKGEKYKISLEVPGIPKEKLDIKATKNHLEVSGERGKEDRGERQELCVQRTRLQILQQAYTYSRGSYSFKNRCKNGTWYSSHNTS